MESHP